MNKVPDTAIVIVNATATETETVSGIVIVTGALVGTGVASTLGLPHLTPIRHIPTHNNPTPRHLHTRTHLRPSREPQGAHRGTPPNLLAINEQHPNYPTRHNRLPTVLPFLDISPRQLPRKTSYRRPRPPSSLSS